MDSAVLETLEAMRSYLERWLGRNHAIQPAAEYARIKLKLISWMLQALQRTPAGIETPRLPHYPPGYIPSFLLPRDYRRDYQNLLEILPLDAGEYDEGSLLKSNWYSQGELQQIYERHVLLIGALAPQVARDYAHEQSLRYERLQPTLERLKALELEAFTSRLKLLCPCCRLPRLIGETTVWQEIVSKYEQGKLKSPEEVRRLAIILALYYSSGIGSWACDRCFAEGRALPARPELQQLKGSYGPPYYAYFDRPYRCRDCGAEAVFSARDQQLWYEQHRLFYLTRQTRCRVCGQKRRRGIRANQALGEALQELNAESSAQLARVAELYLQLERPRKALEYLRRAKNKAASEDERAALLERIEGLRDEAGSMKPEAD